MGGYNKRGYLNSDFKIFHLTDQISTEFEFHYHEFHKITIFISGNVQYFVEGKTYPLEPYDIVLVNRNDIHRVQVDPSLPYERIIVYLSPRFITSYRSDTYDLSDCFHKAKELRSNVLRIHSLEKSGLFKTITDLEYACAHDGYAKELYCQVVFLEFMIKLNRAALTGRVEYISPGTGDRRISAVMEYIAGHLTEDLTVDQIADAAYLSRYHLMHLFKQATGYTLGNYITEKRLLLARDLLRSGTPVTSVCFDCGFKNYSTFSRAYKKYFESTPSDAKKT